MVVNRVVGFVERWEFWTCHKMWQVC